MLKCCCHSHSEVRIAVKLVLSLSLSFTEGEASAPVAGGLRRSQEVCWGSHICSLLCQTALEICPLCFSVVNFPISSLF